METQREKAKGQKERLREMRASVSREIIRDRDKSRSRESAEAGRERLGTQISGEGINSLRLNQVEGRQR